MVNPLLAEIKHRRGLYEFRIVCDETTNTPYNIDNGVMVAEVWLKPTKAAERLINRFVITSTGASFSELIAQQ
jgi:phage tail sheath protein FI